MSENSASNLYTKLTTLKDHIIPSGSDIRCNLNRDVDFAYKHRRIIIKLNSNNFQIDLLLRNAIHYVPDYDVVFRDKQTCGLSEDEKIVISYSKGIFVEGKSFKLAY